MKNCGFNHGFEQIRSQEIDRLNDAFFKYGTSMFDLKNIGTGIENYQTNVKSMDGGKGWLWEVYLTKENNTSENNAIRLLFPIQWDKKSIAVCKTGDINDSEVDAVVREFYKKLVEQKCYGIKNEWIDEGLPTEA